MLGKYHNVGIIDIDKSLFLFKNYFFLLSNTILKGGYLFLSWNNLNCKEYTVKFYFCRFIYKWVPGMVTNFRKVKKSDLFLINFFDEKKGAKRLRFPNFVINFGPNKDISVQEGRRLPLPFLSIVDTLHLSLIHI
eukprot:TRINITY_DN729_c0_g2_i3.p2 TRINITY_DN729_c0_g2~~TRINITY_DN729_c0_g2_i3.p2  ORF type:complete len:135 (-),score=4.12 TRINITY_DN729_c0_g2_i3:44-448(-)